MTRVVAVFGVSGVGKSWLISRYSSANPVTHVQAGQLLRDAKAAISGSATTSEELRTGAVMDNQALLIPAFSCLLSKAQQPLIFDGHCVVDNGDQLIEIPVEVVRALSPTGLIFVRSRPDTIAERRRMDVQRVRPVRSIEEIGLHQNRAADVCARYANQLQLGLQIVNAGDEQSFAAAVGSFLA